MSSNFLMFPIQILIASLIFFPTSFSSKLRQTVIITGGNRGIGFSACKKLAASNEWSIILACRSKERALKAISTIPTSQGRENIEILELDLSDSKSVKNFAAEIIKSKRVINVLACNAGIQLTGSGNKPQRTKDGFESTVGVNHLGHFLLVSLLLKSIKSVKGSRIVFTGSGVHNPDEAGGNVGIAAGLGDLSGLKGGFRDPIAMVDGGKYDPDKAYKDSKLCNVITAQELARRLKADRSSVTCNVMNPGLIPTTGLFRDINPIFVTLFTFLTRYVFKVAVSEEVGGDRLAFMIADPSLNNISGKYYSSSPRKDKYEPYEVSKEAQDLEKAKKLWELSSKLVS